MIFSRRWNRFWIGLALGVVLPVAVFFLVYLFGDISTTFRGLPEYAFMAKVQSLMLTNILILCALPNFAVFYFFLNKEYWNTAWGVIAATSFCTLAVAAIRFFA